MKRKSCIGVALVTGAAGIVGPEICRVLHERGWQVAATDRDERDFELAEKAEGKSIPADFQSIADLSKKAACDRLIRETEQALGPITLLINNAAVAGREKSLAEIDEERALRLFQINALAPLWLIAAAETSLKGGRGTVINISSAQTVGWLPENHLYVASKAALEKLTETLAGSLSPFGVRTICLRLGSFPGSHFLRDFLRRLPPEAARQMTEDILPIHFQSIRDALGANHTGTPRELAEAIAFLAGEEARMFNGCILDFDGGYTRRPTNWPGAAQSAELAREWFAQWQAAQATPAASR